MAIGFRQVSLIYRRKLVFPVPALPVRKMFRELSFTSLTARLNNSFSVSGMNCDKASNLPEKYHGLQA